MNTFIDFLLLTFVSCIWQDDNVDLQEYAKQWAY